MAQLPPVWADASQGLLAILAVGGAIYFVETFLAGRQFAPNHAKLILTWSAACLLVALIYFHLPRIWAVRLLAIYASVGSILGLMLAIKAWQRKDEVAPWIFVAYFPLALALLAAIARAQGWIPISWLVQYGVVIALLLEVPLMMWALQLRSRQRHEILTRGQAAATRDALTGCLREIYFDDRIRQSLKRFEKRREDSAILIVNLVNYSSISKHYSAQVSEQALIQSVSKFQRVLRDVDTIARVQNHQFGLILEGVKDRQKVLEVASRLVAQGLMPLKNVEHEVVLQFHVAALVLRETKEPISSVKEALLALLGSMSPKTHRPIRFLELLSLDSSKLESDSADED